MISLLPNVILTPLGTRVNRTFWGEARMVPGTVSRAHFPFLVHSWNRSLKPRLTPRGRRVQRSAQRADCQAAASLTATFCHPPWRRTAPRRRRRKSGQGASPSRGSGGWYRSCGSANLLAGPETSGAPLSHDRRGAAPRLARPRGPEQEEALFNIHSTEQAYQGLLGKGGTNHVRHINSSP